MNFSVAPLITCNIKAHDNGGSEVSCKVKANPLANVKVIKDNKVIGSKVSEINFENDDYQKDQPDAGSYGTQNDDDAYDNNQDYPSQYKSQGGIYENDEDDDDDDDEGEEEEDEESDEENEEEKEYKEIEHKPQLKVEDEKKENFDVEITNQVSNFIQNNVSTHNQY